MKKRFIASALSLILVLSAAAQDAQPTPQYVKAISQEQATEIATQYLIKRGESMDMFEASETAFFDEERGWYILFFQTKTHEFGGDISVRVSPEWKVWGKN